MVVGAETDALHLEVCHPSLKLSNRLYYNNVFFLLSGSQSMCKESPEGHCLQY